MSFRDVEGIEHSVEVTAESLYEAAVLRLHALKQSRLSSGPGEVSELVVSVRSPVTSHKLTVRRLLTWLESNGRSPKEHMLEEAIARVTSRLAVSKRGHVMRVQSASRVLTDSGITSRARHTGSAAITGVLTRTGTTPG